MSGSGEAVGGGGALAAATGAAEGGSEAMGGGHPDDIVSASAPLDYTTMSGAEFQRAVGVDPEKWAEAFKQCANKEPHLYPDVAAWFRDAMDAARNDLVKFTDIYRGTTSTTKPT